MAAGGSGTVLVTELSNPLPVTGSKVGARKPAIGRAGSRLIVPVSFQHYILGIGFAVLAGISATSIALDVKSRTDAAWVRHTLEALNKIADTRLSFRRAESAARGYLVTNDQYFMDEYRQFVGRIAPSFAELRAVVADNPAQIQLLESSEPIVSRRFSLTSESIRLSAAGDAAGIAALMARAEGSTLMEAIDASFEQLAKEERRLLEVRTATSERTGSVLLAFELGCAALILLLAAILTRAGLRSRRRQADRQRDIESVNHTLEIAVAERTEHLLVAHENLRHSTSVLTSTFASLAEAVIVVDIAGEVVLANSAAEHLLHCCPGMPITQLLTPNATIKSDELAGLATGDGLVASILRGEQLDGLEIVIRCKGDKDPTEFVVSGRALLDASGLISGGALVFHDVTLARETERKLRQSQKLDAIGKLTGGVAHDFNNMLTVIGGTTEILVERLHSRPDLQAVAVLISQAADRCTELIQHLLAFARKQPLRPRNVDVNATVSDIGKLLRPTLGEQIEVVSILEPGIAPAHVDPSQLANALINLAINARDAMPEGGKLTLETSGVVLDKAYAQSHADVEPGAYVMLAVSDTGVGMSAELRDKVFEPFFTTKEIGKGTGLGLSMVYGFAKQSGGHVKIDSEPALGTTIKLYLPVGSGKAEADVPVVASVPGAGETILVVEDDSLVRDFVVAQLHSLGYKTLAAAQGPAALAYLESGRPFDLLFTDVVMPGGMTGRQLADEIVKSRPNTKVLYTSGYAGTAVVHQGRLDRNALLLSKPYRKSTLASMLRRALGDPTIEILEPASIRLAGTSAAVPMRRLPASGQALSLG